MRKVNEVEAKWIQLVSSVGLDKKSIADRYNYKYMDVVNVLRGNAYSHVTGILNRNIGSEEVTVVKYLLKQEHPYREIASFAGIDANKVRNIRGYLQHKKVI
ncbi:hypothetical protein JCM17380_24420 [Desulfosporosinus burensis]